MRVSRLTEEPGSAHAPAPLVEKDVRVETAGGVVHLRALPVPSEDRDLPIFDLLTRYVTGWDATNDSGEPEPLNADRIHQLTPTVKDAFREAILGRARTPNTEHRTPKAVEKVAVKEEAGHGSFDTPAAKTEEKKS